MSKRSDVAPGEKHGRLTFISEAQQQRPGVRRVLCKCDCGGVKVVNLYNWKDGHVKSCGCLKREKGGEANRTHGLSGFPAYHNWKNMHARCYDTSHPSYKRYGAKGVKVCKRWHDVRNFIEDMGQNLERLTLERENSRLDYSKDNCVWATHYEQSRNRGKEFSNTSGVTGVDSYSRPSGAKYWRARWVDKGGKQRSSESFDVRKYGEAEAFRLACEAREAALKEHGYSDKHGK